MKSKFLVFALIVAVFAGMTMPSFSSTAQAAGYQSAPAQSHTHFFDKTRFLFHMGLAFGAFHHWVYKPYRAGSFKKGSMHRVLSIVKAAAALAFAYHEFRAAYVIAKGSNSKTLHFLVSPLNSLNGKLTGITSRWKSGKYSDGDVKNLNGQFNSLGNTASSNGFIVKDLSHQF